MTPEETIQRRYFTMEQVCETLGVSGSLIRLYDRELNLGFRRNGKGDRVLTASQLGLMAVIVRLRKYLSLSGIKEAIRHGIALEILDSFEPDHLLEYEEDLTEVGTPIRII